MNPAQSISSVFSQYFGFSGRACRSEYWWFFLFEFIAFFVLPLISWVLGLIFFAAVFVPALAVLVRRLHDTNRTGWWVLLSIIPFGSIVLLIFAVLPGQPGQNKYGPNPLRPGDTMGSDGVPGFSGEQRNQAPFSDSRYCTNCGSLLEPAGRFCRSCGTTV